LSVTLVTTAVLVLFQVDVATTTRSPLTTGEGKAIARVEAELPLWDDLLWT
jgi:hypothetical protein